MYIKSDTDNPSRNQCEHYYREIIPQLLLNIKEAGKISGDWNCITNAKDCTKHPDAKMSPSLKRIINLHKDEGVKRRVRVAMQQCKEVNELGMAVLP